MGKSEQFRYTPLEGERDQPQISVDAEALYDLLIRAETMVSKVDRIRYIHRAEDQILDVIAEYRLAYPSQIEHFLASINSFLGMMKHRNDYGKIRDLVEEVSPKWFRYCHYNDDRRCFEANEGYKHNDLLIRKYGFKFNKLKHKNNDKTGNRRAQERVGLAHS